MKKTERNNELLTQLILFTPLSSSRMGNEKAKKSNLIASATEQPITFRVLCSKHLKAAWKRVKINFPCAKTEINWFSYQVN